MANTVTQRTLVGAGASAEVVLLINITSDGTEESALVIYDNSALVADVSKGSLMEIQASGSSCMCTLAWDQTTDSPVISFDPASNPIFCFRQFGGIKNPNGTGATGDLLLTTASLDNGDVVTLLITIRQS